MVMASCSRCWTGLSLIKSLGASYYKTPMLILSALGEVEVENRVEDSEMGADDYLVKSFVGDARPTRGCGLFSISLDDQVDRCSRD